MRLDLLVTLKTVDLVRETAWLTLAERLGWGERLTALARHRLWRYEGEALAGAASARQALAAELERSSAYYNPNKERLRWLEAGELEPGEILSPPALDWQASPPPASASRWQLGLWVTDEGGAAETQRRLSAARLDPAAFRLDALSTGSYWELELLAADADEARTLLAALALSRGRRQGLLLNPHYQEGRLLRLSPAPMEVSA